MLSTTQSDKKVCERKKINKVKCGKCSRKLPKCRQIISCDFCKKFYHAHCSGITKKQYFERTSDWSCDSCVNTSLPFSNLSNDEILNEINGLNAEKYSNNLSFSTQ